MQDQPVVNINLKFLRHDFKSLHNIFTVELAINKIHNQLSTRFFPFLSKLTQSFYNTAAAFRLTSSTYHFTYELRLPTIVTIVVRETYV